MKTKPQYISSLLLFFLSYCHLLHHSDAQPEANTTGFTCTTSQYTYPCQTYAFYQARAPDFLDLASIGDLFSVSRLKISEPSNISSPSSALVAGQPLFVPISCSCNSINTTTNFSYANLSYVIKPNDTFYIVSTFKFMNLTTYYSVELVNPTLVPTNLSIGVTVLFPIFCKCPNTTQVQNRVKYLISYVFQPFDNLSSVASRFNVSQQSIIDVNGNNFQPFNTIFIPVTELPKLSQPVTSPSPPPAVPPPPVEVNKREGVVTGLAIGLAITGFLLLLLSGLWVNRETALKKRKGVKDEEERQRKLLDKEGKGLKGMDVNLMADVSDCLDKYRVFKIEELIEATDGFSESCLVQGSVYKGYIDGEVYAIKKMKWNAYEELKILQKVNHGNLVRLEGFCIDPEDGTCYLIYEFVENGSLDSWLHGNKDEKMNWKTRLRIAIDVANGLQYIHEHTRPRVVHKDIKSSNILLDMNFRAKIANFGLAKSGCNAITMHIVGTQGYIAPEYLADGVVSTKMDVFSFGVVLLELISGKEALDEEGNVLWAKTSGILDGNEERKVKRVKQWMDEVLVRESCSMDSLMNVMSIAIACLHRDPTKRPSMVDVVYALCKSDDFGFEISDDGLSAPLVDAR
ncbi:serine/threonine receptor-like kinase NFP [Castanea sativa]|uniref:serine/threonine receptor-like kinase NFP n=1 Tax=Castanea sativa TaxID=21020 RepID=UPI003F64DBED